MSASRSGSGRDSWVHFLTVTLGNRERFRRFMIVLISLLIFVLIAGWLWGGTVPTLVTTVGGLWRGLRHLFRN